MYHPLNISDVARPAFRGVEGVTRSAFEYLPAQEIAKDRLAIRFGNVGLDERTAELPEVIDHQVHGDVVMILRKRADTTRNSHKNRNSTLAH